MDILRFLASSNYIVYNKELSKIIGIEETVLLGELASESEYWKDKSEDGYFYSTIQNIEENTNINEYEQRKAIKKLQRMNVIDVKLKGCPAKRYIKINEEQVLEILKNNTLNFKELEPQILKGNNNIINKNINKNINNMNIIYNNWDENVTCECITKDKSVCLRRSSFSIDGKNHCNQHAKSKIGSYFEENNKDNFKCYGEYKRVKLKDEQYNKLVEEYGKEYIDQVINRLDEYIQSNNNKNKYKDFNLVIRKSIRDNWFNIKPSNNITEQEYHPIYKDITMETFNYSLHARQLSDYFDHTTATLYLIHSKYCGRHIDDDVWNAAYDWCRGSKESKDIVRIVQEAQLKGEEATLDFLDEQIDARLAELKKIRN